MANEDESLWMVYNGEIYNAPELREYCEGRGHTFRSNSDGEVILHLWEMEGWRSLRRLNGIFAVAIADSRTGEMYIARDPMGVKPLFYCQRAGKELWFGSEVRGLLEGGCAAVDLDTIALAQFLTFLWIPDPRSPYENIRSLEPAHVLRWNEDGIKTWGFGDAVALVMDRLEVRPDQLETELQSAVQRQLMSDVPVGLMASGGIDSSLIWHYARASLTAAYTIDWSDTPGTEGLTEDTQAVRWLEQVTGTPVHYLKAPHGEIGSLPKSGDLFADPAYSLVRSIARSAAADGCKVLFSGQGGDELFAGYRRHSAARFLESRALRRTGRLASVVLRPLRSSSLRYEYAVRMADAMGRDPFDAYLSLCSYSTSVDRARALDCTDAEVSDEVVWARHRDVYDRLPNDWSMLRKVLLLDLSVYLPGLGLAYTDRGGMDAGVEIRVPFLDLDLVSWALALPDRELIRAARGKIPPRQLAQRVLGDEIAGRRKRGFGVPREMLTQDGDAPPGALRQAQYFTLAHRMLNEYVRDARRT